MFRRRRAQASWCDDCSQACSPACRAEAYRDRERTRALTWSVGPR